MNNQLNRRHFLRLAAAGAAACLLPRSLLSAVATAQAKKLNVLFIVSDDLRPELGCYGVKRALSPNIDKLAARGTLFERAYCQQAVCSPSRSSLLTGCRPDTTKIYDLETHFRSTIPDVITLPQHFKASGYDTRGFGKIYHNGLDDAPSWSVPHWMPRAGQYHDPKNIQLAKERLAEAKAKAKAATVPSTRVRGYAHAFECADVPDNAYVDGLCAEKVIETLKEVAAGDKPFFLAAGFAKPHLPFVAPKKYWDMYKRADIQLPDNPQSPLGMPPIAASGTSARISGELRTYAGIPDKGPLPDEKARELIHGYLACVSYLDAQIGRVLDELDRLGLRENTVVVLWGDHGWKLGEHGMWCKHTNFELDTRSALIVSMPHQKAAGKHTTGLVEFVDVYPTLCELAGLSLPKHLEGSSFAPLLDVAKDQWKAAAFSQYPRAAKGAKVMGYSMRTDLWRYTEWRKVDGGEVIAVELYDHTTDPNENVNIAADKVNAQTLSQLAAQMKAGWQGGKL